MLRLCAYHCGCRNTSNIEIAKLFPSHFVLHGVEFNVIIAILGVMNWTSLAITAPRSGDAVRKNKSFSLVAVVSIRCSPAIIMYLQLLL